jgi:hypothetical protein
MNYILGPLFFPAAATAAIWTAMMMNFDGFVNYRPKGFRLHGPLFHAPLERVCSQLHVDMLHSVCGALEAAILSEYAAFHCPF